MIYQRIDGELYKKLVSFGYFTLKNNVKEVNDLNVFPIPDGDTGENMCATMLGSVKVTEGVNGELDETSKRFSDSMLLNARGNSGVILSQMFCLLK